MARKKNRRGARHGFTIPLAAAAGFVPLIIETQYWWRTGGWRSGLSTVCAGLTGYNPEVNTWSFDTWMRNSGPIILGLAVHKLVGSKLGINRAIARAGVPWLRI